ncbi:metal-dependent hydrolase [Devosia sp. PTR5]|jgi:L-ascorbate metabolism protein UlaG (beta-lactamase superfamily)|uniref:UPF0173 metal-dependent hydrolase IC608_12135 n=1 Tax=Devosia oryzisoli TaxID=2774138 RepID=A0A927FWL2_9HYPH|nr:metal-dependent hydrolase [Devosia oryzisoli]MBD8066218.1 metal-dependent hydrolase [Devosia oryzisoli]
MQIHYLGHSAFKIVTGDAVVLFDPFLTGNPKFSGNRDAMVADVTHVLVTHGHNDHFGDTIDILKMTGATLVSTPELCGYVASVFGDAKTRGMNIGGTAKLGAISVSMVKAFHSSSYSAPDGRTIYGGMPTGLILKAEGKALYHMGDTDSFGDMALINELHRPDIGIVPIGDNFTMGPDEAALAVNRFFAFTTVIPCHYGTFGLLEQSADGFAAKVTKGRVEVMAPLSQLTV